MTNDPTQTKPNPAEYTEFERQLAQGMNKDAYAPHEAEWAKEEWPVFLPHARSAIRVLSDMGVYAFMSDDTPTHTIDEPRPTWLPTVDEAIARATLEADSRSDEEKVLADEVVRLRLKLRSILAEINRLRFVHIDMHADMEDMQLTIDGLQSVINRAKQNGTL